MNTEEYCTTLDKLDPVEAIRAIHRAWLQLVYIQRNGADNADCRPVLEALGACMEQTGHVGFSEGQEVTQRAIMGRSV